MGFGIPGKEEKNGVEKISLKTILKSLNEKEKKDFQKGMNDPNAFDACSSSNIAFDASNEELENPKK